MRVKPGIVIVDSIDDVLSLRHPASFKVIRNQYISAWHYVLYMKAMRLQLYGTADRILAVKEPEELDAMAERLEQEKPERWLQNVRLDLDVANSNKFQTHSNMREVILGTGAKLIVSTTHRGTLWSAPALAEDQHLSDKATWIGCNLEGIFLMRTREYLALPHEPAFRSDRYTEPLTLRARIRAAWAWDLEFSMVTKETYAAWLAQIRNAPQNEVISELFEMMRRNYWDVDVHDPRRAEFVDWVKSELMIELPPDPMPLRSK